MTHPYGPEQHEHAGPVIRDKRRIDPVTGEVREPQATAVPDPAAPRPAGGPSSGAPDVELEQALAERTADLQRLQAEYLNYKRRVDRDREVVRDTATASVLTALLPVLDDIGRARQHDELEGAFKSVGEALEGLVAKLGLESYAEPGDGFDPLIHEALTAVPTPEPGEPVVLEVFQPGYRFAGRVVRPARVVVSQPAEPTPPEGGETV